jgi:hypothetical protein
MKKNINKCSVYFFSMPKHVLSDKQQVCKYPLSKSKNIKLFLNVCHADSFMDM